MGGSNGDGEWRGDQGTAKNNADKTDYMEIKYNSRLLKLLHTYIKIIHKKSQSNRGR